MPGDRYEHDAAARRERSGDTHQREAARRVAIRQRARELKQALLASTMRLSGRHRAIVQKAVRKARSSRRSGSALLHYCLVLFSGAVSMLIPFPSTCSLHGQLLAATQPALGMQEEPSAASITPAALPRALVYAQPAQCSLLGYEEPGSAIVDAHHGESARFEARIVRLVPHAAPLAEGKECHIELELRAQPNIPEPLHDLPPGAAVSVELHAQPRSWLAMLVEQAAGDGSLDQASGKLQNQVTHLMRQTQGLYADIARGTQLGRALSAGVADIFKSSDDEDSP